MFDIAHLFIGTALAQGAAPAPAAGATDMVGSSLASISNFLPLILIFVVFYVLIIRPQQKKLAEQEKMIKALKRGDRVITSGGIYGKITKLDDDTLTVEVADNINIKVVRAQVQSLAAKTDTTIVANDGSADEKKN
jgi:preprotein translocase subunit YajC